jgi:RecA-family ATPase
MSPAPDWKKRKQLKYDAEWRAQVKGGEESSWVDQLIREQNLEGKPFQDAFLKGRGYEKQKEYNYNAPDGFLVFQAVRYYNPHINEKVFVYRRQDPDKQFLFGDGGSKIIYNWMAVASRKDEPVYICEGEKDADRLASNFGLLSTTVPGQHWTKVAARALKDRDVFILEDADEAGEKNAKAARKELEPFAKSIKIIKLPGLAYGEDVSDWLDKGHTKDELIAICQDSPRWGIALFNVCELDGVERPVTEWSVNNRLPVGYASLFSGEGAAGKSLIELQRSVAHALTVNWLGVTPTPGRALFIEAEDGPITIHQRLYDILDHHGYRFADLKDKFYVASLVEEDTVMAQPNRKSGRLETTSLYDRIFEMAGDIKPISITIASSANVFAGNELDRGQVQQFMSALTRIARVASGSLVLISHPSLTGINSGSGLSGSTQWHNSVRARYYITGVKNQDGEPEGDLRVISFKKNNYGPVTEEIVVRYQNGLFVPANTTVDQAARAEQADEVYLTVMRLLIDQNRDLSPSPASPDYAPKLISEHPGSKPFRKQDMEQAQQRLLNTNQIHIKTSAGPPSRQKKLLVPGPAPRQEEAF